MRVLFSIHSFNIINRHELESIREKLQNLRETLKKVKQTNDQERIQEIEDAISNCQVSYSFDGIINRTSLFNPISPFSLIMHLE